MIPWSNFDWESVPPASITINIPVVSCLGTLVPPLVRLPDTIIFVLFGTRTSRKWRAHSAIAFLANHGSLLRALSTPALLGKFVLASATAWPLALVNDCRQ